MANTFALQNQNNKFMAGSEDFQSIYELYKKEGIPNGISIVNFCRQNGIVYSQFERWFKSGKKSKSSVHPIRVVDKDGLMSSSDQEVDDEPSEVDNNTKSVLRFGISVRTSQGLSIRQNNLTYRQMLQLVEKLEVLC